MSKRSVAVVFGGASSEYEVSLRSASFVISGVDRDRYDLTLIGITKRGQWLLYTGPEDAIACDEWNRPEYVSPAVLPPDPIHHGLLVLEKSGIRTIPLDVVFPVLHGKNGEDGTIQGVLEMAQIPYAGCGVLSSAICMDKGIAHTVMDQAGIPNAMWADLYPWDLDDFDVIEAELADSLGYPMFVKPANAGSSVGVSKATDKESLRAGLNLAFVHDSKVIVEEFIKGREVECAVLGNHDARASVLGEIAPKKEFYDYAAKYEDDSTDLYVPARIPEETADLVRELALAAFEALGCQGLARVDFFVKEDEIILNEVNTLPGFTGISMYPRLIMAGGMSAQELVSSLIELAFSK